MPPAVAALTRTIPACTSRANRWIAAASRVNIDADSPKRVLFDRSIASSR